MQHKEIFAVCFCLQLILLLSFVFFFEQSWEGNNIFSEFKLICSPPDGTLRQKIVHMLQECMRIVNKPRRIVWHFYQEISLFSVSGDYRVKLQYIFVRRLEVLC